jgi:cell division protein FtsI/penicillin-binding protein 2
VTNRAIRRLAAFFVVLFVALVVRQAYVQIVLAPSIAVKAGNPRHALLDANRGRILATDGSVLAQTVDGHRVYALGAALAQVLG